MNKKNKTMKHLPFVGTELHEIIQKYPTPFYLYDEGQIRCRAKELKNAFSWNQGSMEFYAVKANPNPFILKILKNEGFGADCSSLAELALAEKCGFTGEEIMFTSNNTPVEEYQKALEMGAIINMDDIKHVEFMEKSCGLPKLLSFRYNPGSRRKGNFIIGKPEESKYGLTHDQLFQAYKLAKEKGVKHFGLHTFIASNELDPNYFIDTARMLFQLAIDLREEVGIQLEFVNLGGGIGIPYKPSDKEVSLQQVGKGIQEAYQEMIVANGLDGLKIYMEYGRVITGPFGYLITKVRHVKKTYKNFAGLDASMSNLMRPGIYNAYHHVSVLEKEKEVCTETYDLTGSLCENNDKFAIDRALPGLEPGDILIIHDVGAHAHAMGFNYNGKLRSAELLRRTKGEITEIRRGETIDDYFKTLDFEALENFSA